MIPTLGYFSLVFAFIISLSTIILPFLSKIIGISRNLNLSIIAVIISFIFILTSFFSLLYSYIISDFSLLNVFNHSHTSKPLIYKIAGTWGNHEGSMLLLVVILSFISTLFTLTSNYEHNIKLKVNIIQSLIIAAFLAFIIFTSNPFIRLFPPAANGLGLNPLLQDLGLAVHPPILYMGYVSFSIPFSVSIVALLNKNANKNWGQSLYIWIILAWSSLTAGIILGSTWAYRELGWGGFWFWDPVENAALIPWLSGTALLHSIISLKKRENLKIWCIFLSISTFILSLVGTFLVRSGIVTSVHAFANDPARGVFILMIISCVTILSFTIFALRAHNLRSNNSFAFWSRDSAIISSNLFLISCCFTVMFGTFTPIFYELLFKKTISIGEPYFTTTLAPSVLLILIFAAIAPFLSWQFDKVKRIKKLTQMNFIITIIVSSIIIYLTKIFTIFSIIFIIAAIFLIVSTLYFLIKKCRNKKTIWANISMILAHIGVGVLILGVVLVANLEEETQKFLSINDTIKLNNYEFKLKAIIYEEGTNFFTRKAKIYVTYNNNEITTLLPELRIYKVENSKTNESSIYSTILSNIYANIGEINHEQKLLVRIYYKPMINLVWLAMCLLILSGTVTIIRTLWIKYAYNIFTTSNI